LSVLRWWLARGAKGRGLMHWWLSVVVMMLDGGFSCTARRCVGRLAHGLRSVVVYPWVRLPLGRRALGRLLRIIVIRRRSRMWCGRGWMRVGMTVLRWLSMLWRMRSSWGLAPAVPTIPRRLSLVFFDHNGTVPTPVAWRFLVSLARRAVTSSTLARWKGEDGAKLTCDTAEQSRRP
jgi:hypothetical protein